MQNQYSEKNVLLPKGWVLKCSPAVISADLLMFYPPVYFYTWSRGVKVDDWCWREDRAKMQEGFQVKKWWLWDPQTLAPRHQDSLSPDTKPVLAFSLCKTLLHVCLLFQQLLVLAHLSFSFWGERVGGRWRGREESQWLPFLSLRLTIC